MRRSLALAIGVPVCLMAASAVALSIEPIYFYVTGGAVTGDNESQGGDGVQNVDITQSEVGWDDQFVYVGIELSGPDKSDQGGDTLEGLVDEYGLHFSPDASGENGFLTLSGGPELEPNTLYARVDPANGNRFEFALDYSKLGLSLDDILDLENVDLLAYPWNETYPTQEAGSSYEFPALGAGYEADTVRVQVTPEPSTVAMVGLGCLGLGFFGSHTRAPRRRAL